MPKLSAAKLTTKTIAGLKYDPNGASLQVAWDTAMPGLGLKVQASGKTWIIRARDPAGLSRRAVLGPYSEHEVRGKLTLAQARTKAAIEIAKLQAGETKPPKGRTLADAYESYKESRWPALAAWTTRGYEARWKVHLRAALGSKRLDRITGGDVQDLYDSLRDKPTTANHVLGLLGTLWNYAAARSDMGITPMSPNPTRIITKAKRYTKRTRERVASPGELSTFLNNVDAAEAEGRLLPHEAVGLLLVPYSLLRVTDVVRLRWQWVDLGKRTITIPADMAKGARIARSDKPEIAVLAKPMVDRLRKLERIDDLVVPSNRGGSRYEMKEPYAVVRPAADLGLYDFKTTSETMLREAGVSQSWIDAAARHRAQDVGQRHYALPTTSQALKAIDRLATLLAKAAK